MGTETTQPEMGNQPDTEMVSTTTQEQTDTEKVTLTREEYEKMLKALKDANNESAKRRKELEDRQKAEMTETERLKKELEEERVKHLGTLRRIVAARHNLPEKLAARLQGTTEDELEADAKELAAELPKPAPKSPGPVAPANPTAKVTLTREMIANMSTAEINKRWDEVQQVLQQK